jgi:hypothetical protein
VCRMNRGSRVIPSPWRDMLRRHVSSPTGSSSNSPGADHPYGENQDQQKN